MHHPHAVVVKIDKQLVIVGAWQRRVGIPGGGDERRSDGSAPIRPAVDILPVVKIIICAPFFIFRTEYRASLAFRKQKFDNRGLDLPVAGGWF